MNMVSMVVHDSEVGDWFLYELFRRLPLKSLFKFKCVSKRWLSLISDPCMRRLYLLLRADHLPVYTLLCNHAPDLSMELVAHPKLESITFRLGFVPQKIQLLDAHNGLLLSCESERHYYVSDPLTARCAALPDAPAFLVDNPLVQRKLTLIVSDSDSRPLYKVIRIQKFGPERLLMDTFDSGTMHWKSSSVPLSCPVAPHDYMMEGPGVLYRGALHWIVIASAMYGHKIVAYDPAAHESRGVEYRCRVFDCPPRTPPVKYHSNWVALGLSAGGEIRYVEHDTSFFFRDPLFMSVWVLKDYDSAEWCLEHKIHPPDVIYVGFEMVDQIFRTFYGVYPWKFDPIDMDIIYYIVIVPGAVLLACYNISTATMKNVCTRTSSHDHSTVLFRLPPWPTSL